MIHFRNVVLGYKRGPEIFLKGTFIIVPSDFRYVLGLISEKHTILAHLMHLAQRPFHNWISKFGKAVRFLLNKKLTVFWPDQGIEFKNVCLKEEKWRD